MLNSYKIVFLIFIILLKIKYSILETECPNCSEQNPCISSLRQIDCPEGEYLNPTGSLCGCCPGCESGMEFGSMFCNNLVPSRRCAPGLLCTNELCVLNKANCIFTYHLSHLKILPTCETDGTFAAVQCKGDRITGRCFCYSETGERIFGWAWWRESNDMTCACSRLKHKMNKNQQYDNTLHCDRKGNFEDLQCNQGFCWCADQKTGDIIKGTRAVPESMWTFLPCYDITKMGRKYLRQCESAAHAQHLMKKALSIHGTTNVEFSNILCDFDGGYGIYYVLNGIASCQWRDGSKIGSYQAASNTISKMSCNCARDQKIFAEAGLSFVLACNGNGNYETLQDINGKMFCIDRDGYAVSDITEEEGVLLDCKPFLYYEITAPADRDYFDTDFD